MADEIDLAQQHAAELLARNIARAVQRPVGISAFFCVDCEAPIAEARRRAIQGVTRCVSCQADNERRMKHLCSGVQ